MLCGSARLTCGNTLNIKRTITMYQKLKTQCDRLRRQVQAGLAVGIACLASTLALAQTPSYPELIRLPDDQRAEGICSGNGDTFYVTSSANARILMGDLQSGTFSTLVAGKGGAGLKFDPRSGLLYVCEIGAGSAAVYHGTTGAEVARYSFGTPGDAVNGPAGAVIINDCVVTKDAVYFTDSHNPTLYRVALGVNGEPAATFTTVALPEDFAWPAGAGSFNRFINANGIAADPDGKYLILVHTGLGRLYRIDTSTFETKRIAISGGDGTDAARGDGILLDGNVLYVVQNRIHRIAFMTLSSDFLSAAINGYISEPFASNATLLKVPTTMAKSSRGFYVVTGSLVPPGPYYVARLSLPDPKFDSIVHRANGETLLNVKAQGGGKYHLQYSTDLKSWNPLATVVNSNDRYLAARDPNRHWFIDSGAPFSPHRIYRAIKNVEPTGFAGDHLPNESGQDVIIAHPRHSQHASVVMKWGDRTIYSDPSTYGRPFDAATVFQGLPLADLIVITHMHPDHYDTNALKVLSKSTTAIIAPQTVFDLMPDTLKSLTTVMVNGQKTEKVGVGIEAIPSYNLDPKRPFHPKGRDNGYVLTMGGKRIYIPGDTEDTPEMRALKDIDVAFMPMNLPFTMTPESAASAVREFKPKVVYPFHYTGVVVTDTGLDFTKLTTYDVAQFKEWVGTDLGIEVRIRDWYEPLHMADRIPADQSEIVVQPIFHSAVLLTWNGKRIYNDPSGGLEAKLEDRHALFQGYPKADIICVSHFHGDHFDTNIIELLKGPTTEIVAPQSVFDLMPSSLKAITKIMKNGETTALSGIPVEAIPSYNLDPATRFHPKGRDNGYVLTIGGKRIYFAGDTEATPEMHALKNIDIAFIPMNLPFTMNVDSAVSAVQAFKPKIVYPFHFINATGGTSQDVHKFKQRLAKDPGIEVRLRSFYSCAH